MHKAPVLSIPEAKITELLSSLDHSMSMHKLHIPRNFKASSKFSSQNYLRDAKLQLNKTITEALYCFKLTIIFRAESSVIRELFKEQPKASQVSSETENT